MSSEKPVIGAIEWQDLTVEPAAAVRDFYQQVIGWHSHPVAMGDYEDFCMNTPETGDTVAGVCHARGCNQNLPAQWLMYVRVADLKSSISACVENQGKVLAGPSLMGVDHFCVIQDPAGAVLALIARLPEDEASGHE